MSLEGSTSAGLARTLRDLDSGQDGAAAFGRLLDAMPLAVIVCESEGASLRVVYLNPVAEAGSRFRQDEATGRPLAEVFEMPDEFSTLCQRVLESGLEWHARGYHNPLSGAVYDLDLVPLTGAESPPSRLLVTLLDVTDHAADRDRMRRLLDSTEALSRPMSPAALAEVTVEQAESLLPGVSAAIVLEVPGEPGRLRVAAGSPGLRERLERGLAVDSALLDSPDLAGRLLPDVPTARVVTLGPGPTELGPGQSLGAIVFNSEAPLSRGQSNLMEEFAKRVGLALHRSQLLAAAEALTARLRAAGAAAAELTGSLDPSLVIEGALRRAAEVAGADRVLLCLLEAGELVVAAGYDRGGRPIPRGRPFPAEEGGGGTGALHVVRVPLVLEGEPAGMMVLSRRQDHPFGPDEVATLDMLARHAAIALRNARLFAAVSGGRRILQAGIDTTLDLVAELDLGRLMGRLLERAVEAVQADRVILYRRLEGSLEVSGGYEREGPAIRVGHRPSPVTRELLARAEAQGAPLVAGPYRPDELGQLDPSVAAIYGEVRSQLVVPLLDQEVAVGFLVVMRRRDAAFEPDEIATLRLIGNGAVLAIRNADLFRELHQANAAKSHFLNVAAHELRSPLSVISGYASLLADGALGPVSNEGREGLAAIVEKSDELASLIDQLLVAARLEAAPPTEARPVPLRRLVGDAVGKAQSRAHLLSGDVVLTLPPRPVTVLGDPDAIQLILDNLINNALNYSPEAPAVSVALTVEDGWAVTRVEDRGVGIAEPLRERVFEEFFRIDTAGGARHSGTGLGLHIARTLAERGGGRLELEWSEPGLGSRFALRLPAD
ncbi:MAG: GAF domain-containing protein [Candidatus Dormibacteraeota bacterium]|nr:GAF domain-containing protein [Candidatus Dormibacteraeota bacterium]